MISRCLLHIVNLVKATFGIFTKCFRMINKREKNVCTRQLNDQSVNIQILSSTMLKNKQIKTTLIYDAGCYTCCFCSECIVGTIMTCGQGHSLCQYCVVDRFRVNEKNCPICNSSDRMRNYILEQVVLDSIMKCSYIGCNIQFYKHKKHEHYIYCQIWDDV
jgi:hypothetical protein